MLDKDAARKHLESAQQFVDTGYGGVISAGYITTLAADLSEALSEIERKDEALTEIARLRTELRGDFSMGSRQSDIARQALTTPSQGGQDGE